MNILILPRHKVVTVDGAMKRLDDFGWLPFLHIRSVEANTDKDRAEIDYCEVDPDESGPLPMVKPPNELTGTAQFFEQFGGILEAYAAHVEAVDNVVQHDAEPDATPLIEHRLALLEKRLQSLEDAIIQNAGGG